jgi:hypothetical protein
MVGEKGSPIFLRIYNPKKWETCTDSVRINSHVSPKNKIKGLAKLSIFWYKKERPQSVILV